MEKIKLHFIGEDSWGRPVYRNDNDMLFVDVEPLIHCPPKICTKYQNMFDGEPDNLARGEFEFLPKRVVWR